MLLTDVKGQCGPVCWDTGLSPSFFTTFKHTEQPLIEDVVNYANGLPNLMAFGLEGIPISHPDMYLTGIGSNEMFSLLN